MIEENDIKDSYDSIDEDDSAEMDKCNIHIHIKNVETINIYNCSRAKHADEVGDPQVDGIDCIPFSDGHKPKQHFQTRLNNFLEKNEVPSVLAATFFHQAHRFVSGYKPENELEQRAFSIFENLPPSTQEILKCVIDRYNLDSQKSQLFSPEVEQQVGLPITSKQLTSFFINELTQRASVYYFDDPTCFDSERAGLFRQYPNNEEDDVRSPLNINISAINGLRTNNYLPILSLGEFRNEEIQQVCTPEIQEGSVVMNCESQTENCSGNSIDGICLVVQEVLQGEAILLQGFNYFSVDGKIRLTGKEPSTISREVEAFVCGDITTGLTETINGVERIILDSRVEDKILFTIPNDLPVGLYSIAVIMPLNGEEVTSQQQFIRVLPPNSTTYQIASEELKAIKETSPAWFGSDEVGIKVLTTSITTDGEVGEISSNNFKFGGLDSGNKRDMSRVLFQQNNISSVVISILGHEIDNDKLYEEEVNAFEDAFVEVLKSNWNAISSGLGASGGALVLALGVSASWAAFIGGAITLAVNLLVAYVGRADLIIEDTVALSSLDLAMLTSINFPAPNSKSYTSYGGIDVSVEPLNKNVQYKEKREYVSDEESSKYHITLRYNNVST